MATYRSYCEECGWTHVGKNPGPTICPCCKSIRMSTPEITEFDSPEEKESYDRACEKRKKTGMFMLMCAVLTFVLFFPGTLILMLLHTVVDIDSDLWNWILTIVFSGVIFIICKGNIITYFKVNALTIVLSTIVGWCVSDFRPWGFAISTIFCNPWLIIIYFFAGIFIIPKYCPGLIDKFVVK
ncbi:MAG: hypothetical protein K2N35_05955 [Muribaculaceae bacterium]|nr:hypothetical protein [Muribaculaceae bacterium]